MTARQVFQPQLDAEGGDIDGENKMHEDKGEKTCFQQTGELHIPSWLLMQHISSAQSVVAQSLPSSPNLRGITTERVSRYMLGSISDGQDNLISHHAGVQTSKK